MAASVSAVSPDWHTETTSVFRSMTGSRYLNSEELSASAGIRARASIQDRPTIAAWRLVPIPIRTTRRMSATSRSDSGKPSSATSFVSNETLPRIESVTASGCSLISLSMKCL